MTYIETKNLSKQTNDLTYEIAAIEAQLLKKQNNEQAIDKLTFQKAVIENRIVQFQALQNNENPELLIEINKFVKEVRKQQQLIC